MDQVVRVAQPGKDEEANEHHHQLGDGGRHRARISFPLMRRAPSLSSMHGSARRSKRYHSHLTLPSPAYVLLYNICVQ